jgi:hypothetical protein
MNFVVRLLRQLARFLRPVFFAGMCWLARVDKYLTFYSMIA